MDDFRESPALEVALKLFDLGCEVRAFDPFAKTLVMPGVFQADSLSEALDGADLMILLVDHAEFKSLNPQSCLGMQARQVLDTRHCLDKALWQQAGFEFAQLGGKA